MSRLYRLDECFCPKCKTTHKDVVAASTPTVDKSGKPYFIRQICDTCFLDSLAPAMRPSYVKYKAEVVRSLNSGVKK